jgi:L-threonate 2-dehydrogenase
MTPVVAIIAAGAMGAGVGKRLTSHGVRVLTALTGRSEATATRARDAGMTAASDEEIAAADCILSILPPGDALSLARQLAPVLAASNAKPVYVDCNAVNPATVERIAAVIAPTGCAFVDVGIIGPPPPPVPPPQAGEGRVGAQRAEVRRAAADDRSQMPLATIAGAASPIRSISHSSKMPEVS